MKIDRGNALAGHDESKWGSRGWWREEAKGDEKGERAGDEDPDRGADDYQAFLI